MLISDIFFDSNIVTVYSSNRSTSKNDLLQVFIGNIPQEVTEEDIRRIFSRFGHLDRVRLHANPRKDWLPFYAFITYENVQSVRQCLAKKVRNNKMSRAQWWSLLNWALFIAYFSFQNTFYWPENSRNGHKLNVNGDPSLDNCDDSGNQKSNDTNHRTRELRQFSRNFVLREPNNKRSPDSDTNISDSVKNERRKWSTRA